MLGPGLARYLVVAVAGVCLLVGSDAYGQRIVDLRDLAANPRRFEGIEVTIAATVNLGEGATFLLPAPPGGEEEAVWVTMSPEAQRRPGPLERRYLRWDVDTGLGYVRATLTGRLTVRPVFDLGHLNCCRIGFEVSRVVALTSRLPVSSEPGVDRVDLPRLIAHPGSYAERLVETSVDVYWGEEGSCVAPPGAPPTACSVALYFSPGLGSRKFDTLRRLLNETDVVPVVVVGRFEDSPEPRWGLLNGFKQRLVVQGVKRIRKVRPR